MPKIMIIANERSRSRGGWPTCESLLKNRPDVAVRLLSATSAPDAVREAVRLGCATIVAAGGDGTVSGVVDAVIGQNAAVRVGVLPLGTFNHIAKDLGIPLDPAAALACIDEAHTILIDVAQVNERVFVNNSSVGMYPYLVRMRQELEGVGISKWAAFVRVLYKILLKRFAFSVQFGDDKETPGKIVSNIFVGNNRYVAHGVDLGSRKSLNEGLLFIAVLKALRTLDILQIVFDAVRGSALERADLDVVGLKACTISHADDHMLVAFDGEVELMQTPLRYEVLPLALQVIVPQQ